VDFLLGPSLNLLSINSTALIALTLASVAVIAFGSQEARGTRPEVPVLRVRMPARELYALVRGARDGYLSNRRAVARIVIGGLAAKMVNGAKPPTGEEVEKYVQEALAGSYDEELFPASSASRARVRPSGTYIPRLKKAISLVEQRLGV
jgi:hypothetical protein